MKDFQVRERSGAGEYIVPLCDGIVPSYVESRSASDYLRLTSHAYAVQRCHPQWDYPGLVDDF